MDRLERIEAAVAASITIGAVWLHTISARSAGALWRDEANTVGLATLPSLTDVWSNLQYDSFPMLWPLLVRSFAGLFGSMNDGAFRIGGMLVGIAIIAVLWFNARSFGHRYPLVSLVLLALSPSVIRYGDSMRAYGLGIALALLAGGMFWRFVREPGKLNFVLATVVALLSVQTLYYNAIVVLAFGAGAIAVAATERNWRKAAAIIAIGLIAAASLVPYASTIQRASSWNALVQIPSFNLGWFFVNLVQTLAPAGLWIAGAWFAAFIVALWAGVREYGKRNSSGLTDRARQMTLFAVVALTMGAFAHFVFLRVLSYLTQPWYYLTLLTTTAACFEMIYGAVVRAPIARVARIVAVIALAAATLPRADDVLRQRMTNMDLVAARLSDVGTAGDVAVVTPWYPAVTFARYYSGPTQWITIPALGFHRYHRYDLIAPLMVMDDQFAPARGAIETTERVLRSGKTVFLVGGRMGDPPPSVPLRPARLPQEGWMESRYQDQWTWMVEQHLRAHSRAISALPIESSIPIGPYEKLGVTVFTGWRD